jgi:hypothetical protein
MKSGADQYAVGAEHQRRRQPTPIGYAARRDHQHVAPQPLGLVETANDIEDQLDLNSGKQWSAMDLFDLANGVTLKNPIEEIARFPCRPGTRCARRLRSWSGLANSQ